MQYIIALLLLSLSFSAHAEQSCDNANSTLEMRDCFSEILTQKKHQLDLTVSSIEEQLKNNSDPNDSITFSKLHNEWVLWADKLCENQRTLFGRGSLAGISFLTCKIHLINSQTQTYTDLYQKSINTD